MAKPLQLIVILQPVSSAFAYKYDPWYRVDTHRPVDIIADVVNELGVKILQQYLTRGNVAFSPTGVAFVLAALYEGSAGRGSQQIAHALGLPNNRDITRIGFRDINRRLRSYLNADGFLGGLTLSKENTRLRPEYEDILRFYGFDLSSIEQEANVTVSAGESSGTTELSTSTLSIGTMNIANISDVTATVLTNATTVSPTDAETTVIPSTATDAVQQTVTIASTDATDLPSTLTSITSTGIVQDMTSTQSANSGESIQSTQSTGAEIVTSSPNTMTIVDSQTTSVIESNQNQQISSTISDDGMSTTVSNENNQTTTSMNANIQAFPTENTASTSTSESPATIDAGTDTVMTTSGIIVNTMPIDIFNTSTVTMNSLTTETSEIRTNPSPVIETMNGIISQSNMTTDTSVETTRGATTTNDSMVIANIEEEVNSTTPETNAISSNFDGNNFTTASSMNFVDNRTVTSLMDENTISLNRKKKHLMNIMDGDTVKDKLIPESSNLRRQVRSPRGYFSSYPDEGIWMQNLDIWKTVNGESVGDSSAEMAFLVNGCDLVSVSASRYIAILPFAYFPSLQAVALEFPLDDPRYNIILFMPTDKTDTHRLARDLSGKSLRLLRKRLQPTWVRATIPSFMLRGFVTLTSFLQRLGILDVFEPRVADLSSMTSDLGVYARDVQQSIGVNIRNYMKPDRTHSRESSNVVPPRRDYYRYLPPGNGLFERAGPESFTALHPFLYFIVDTETSVSLIAGRVDDPLNSRIL